MSVMARQLAASAEEQAGRLDLLGIVYLHQDLPDPGLSIDALIEPLPPSAWREKGLASASYPVFLVVRCLKD
jgi:hypothetical protein